VRPPGEGGLKGRYPFRLGTTSYILPEGLIPNALHLAPRVDDVELVLFDEGGFSNLPSPEEVERLGRIGREGNLTYTVHLLQDVRLGSPNEAERRRSLDRCRDLMDRMDPLSPFAWVLHLTGELRGDPPSADLPAWRRNCRRSLEELAARAGDPRSICVETLDYDFDVVGDLVEGLDLGVCLDVGHLIVGGRDVEAHLDRWLGRSRVLHLHGVRPDGTDHVDLSFLAPDLREGLFARLAREAERDRAAGRPHERVLTMEIFGEADFARSLEALRGDGGGPSRGAVGASEG